MFTKTKEFLPISGRFLLVATLLLSGVIAVLAQVGLSARAVASEPDPLAERYTKMVRPILASYCQRCHGSKRTEAEVDFEQMTSLAEVRKNTRTWQKVSEMLESRQMPPMGAKQPAEADRANLVQWVHEYLTVEARARAGDPGPVVLRRLSNAEYTYTLRDLTGVDSLQPAREFPVDGAAGEGFTNTGNALVMSPTLISKYLDAAKDVANHAVLLPDGFVFSPHTTRRDWTDDTLKKIRTFYSQFADSGGGEKVNLQGIVFDTNQGGRLPVEKYLQATLAERESLKNGRKTIAEVASERKLNAKYLGTLWEKLNGSNPSFLLDHLRTRWANAKPEEAAALAGQIAQWQKSLWKVQTVGQIGKVGGPKAWQEPFTPLVAGQDLRFKIPSDPANKEVHIHLVAGEGGDGNDHDSVVWRRPRLVMPGGRELLLRDVRDVTNDLEERRTALFANTAKFLNAAAEASGLGDNVDVKQLAAKHDVPVDDLAAWLDYLGLGTQNSTKIENLFTGKIPSVSGYDFIQGWGTSETPLLIANSSDRRVRVPGNMKAHGVAVHPSPTLQAVVGWRSPVTATFRVQGQVTHAHPECGNGVTWSLELRRGSTRQRLAVGVAQGSKPVDFGPFADLSIHEGDVVSLLIGPRDGNHACDLTGLELKLTSDRGQAWDMAADVSQHVLASNPLPDRLGHPSVWYFYTEPDKPGAASAIPADSLLAKWQVSRDGVQKQKLADDLQRLLTSGPPQAKESPDGKLYRQLVSLNGPLFRKAFENRAATGAGKARPSSAPAGGWGLDPAGFGKNQQGKTIDAEDLHVRAPSIVEIRLPAELVAGSEFMTGGGLDVQDGSEGSVQLQLLASKPATGAGFVPGIPIVANPGSQARTRIEKGFDEFRELFPPALCYTKIVPVDEVITLTLFYREDDQLVRLMLDEKQKQYLDRLWDELHFISQDALTLVDAFAQLLEYASQDADPKVFEPMRKPIHDRAAAFRKRLIDAQPHQLDALVDFAGRAFRRPLTEADKKELRDLYAKLRKQELTHEQAFRLTLARVLVSPAFLYKLERPSDGTGQTALSDWELASRLSYFLWSSEPDTDLRKAAAAGLSREPAQTIAQARRMLSDDRVRRLATEFACQWLHIYDFDHLDEKSERHFPTFLALREAMYEESIQFFTYLFQHDRPVAELFDADYTFVNEALARHYGITSITGSQWRKVDGVRQFGRGGILGLATTLAKQSGASRTSPILRGNWISEVLLGERLPRPPKDVPRLPEDETSTKGLTVRQLVEKHSSDPRCAVCHQRIDAFGFSLESFDAIGRKRDKDLGDRPIDTRVQTMDGSRFDGIDGLRNYLLTQRREAVLRQFCRKLLGYALGRAIQLSDEPLLAEMQDRLKDNACPMSTLIECIVRSRQFREIRGRLVASEE